MSDEARRAKRVAIPRVLVRVATVERLRNAYLKDLSSGGLFIKTDRPLAVDRTLEIDLLPPGRTDPIRLKGKVVRVQEGEAARASGSMGMAIQFFDLPEEASAAVKALIAEHDEQSQPAPQSEPIGDDRLLQLTALMGQISTLRESLATREQELEAERARRKEGVDRFAGLVLEFETLREQTGSASNLAATEQIRAELRSAQSELTEVRARLTESEASCEAYRQELDLLEQDDSTVRQLAQTLAKDKTRAEQEARLAREETEKVRQELEAAKSVAATDAIAHLRAIEAQQQRTAEGELAARQDVVRREQEHKRQLDELRSRVIALTSSEREVGMLRERIASLERSLKEEKASVERRKTKERELRQLLAAVSKGGDDVVVVDIDPSAADDLDDAEPELEPPQVPASTAAGVGAEAGREVPLIPPVPAGAALDSEPSILEVAELVAAAPAMPGPPSAPADDDDALPDLPQEFAVDVVVSEAAAESTNPDSWGNQTVVEAPAPLSRDLFLQRLHRDDPLIRTPRFADYAAAGPNQSEVLGLLQGATRFGQLKTLARGVVEPVPLAQTLYLFHTLGLIAFN